MKWIFNIYAIAFIVSGISLIVFTWSKSWKDQKKLWLHYIFYVIQISIILLPLMNYVPMYMFVLQCILFLGFLELWLRDNKRNALWFWGAIGAYVIIGTAFYLYQIYTPLSAEIARVFFAVSIFDFVSRKGLYVMKGSSLHAMPDRSLRSLILGVLLAWAAWILTTDFHILEFFKGLILMVCTFLAVWLSWKYKSRFAIERFSNRVPTHGGVLDVYFTFELTCAGLLIWNILMV